MRLLVVEDDPDLNRQLCTALTDAGYAVDKAFDGEEGHYLGENEPYDAVVLDLGLPKMDGISVLESWRRSGKMMPVLILTARDRWSDKVQGFDVGADDYVAKPFHLEEVLARVKAHVALRRTQVALNENYRRLRELERLRDDLVHMVVHDMRSPLTALEISLGLLEENRDPARSDDHSAILRMAIETTADLNRMANDLLDVSRLESGKMPLDLSMCDLTKVASEVRAAIGRIAPGRSIDVDASGPVEIRCDVAIVRRVMDNLVGNGIKHTPRGSRIHIDVVMLAGRARVAVHDEGPGVPLEARDKIFEKFETVATRAKPASHSAGLGLAFCKLAVEAHGGTIGVDARAPVGSTFWFELPM